MDTSLFRDGASGQLVPISGVLPNGTTWRHVAFLPDPLGDDSPDVSGAAYRKVADARAALAELDSTARRLPNPRLFRHPSLRLEAQSTAALEGTYEPVTSVLATDAHDEVNPSMREVLNYIDVAETAFEWNEEGRQWTPSALAELQRQLLAGTRAERDYTGLRPIQVVVGRRADAAPNEPPVSAARYVRPPPGPDLEARLADLLRWMQSDHSADIDPVVAAGMVHYAFEALHPFHDGNGRIGRLLIVLQLHRQGVLTEPTITVSPWFETRRTRYFDALLGVTTVGDWSTWIEFFAEGLAYSARETTRRMIALAEVQAVLKEQVRQGAIRSANAPLLVDFAMTRTTFTVTQAAAALDMQYQGAKKLIDSLARLGILAPYDERAYGRRFHAPRVLEVLLRG